MGESRLGRLFYLSALVPSGVFFFLKERLPRFRGGRMLAAKFALANLQTRITRTPPAPGLPAGVFETVAFASSLPGYSSDASADPTRRR